MKKFISKLTAVTMAGLFIATPCVYGAKHPRPVAAQTSDTADSGTTVTPEEQNIIATIWRLENQAAEKSWQTNIEQDPRAMRIWRTSMVTLLNKLSKETAIFTVLEIAINRNPEFTQAILPIIQRQGLNLEQSCIAIVADGSTGATQIVTYIYPIEGNTIIPIIL